MRRALSCSNEFPLLTKGNAQKGTPADASAQHWKIVLLAGRRECGGCHARASSETRGCINTDLEPGIGNGYWTKMSPRDNTVPLAEPQYHVIDPTNSCRALDDGIKHRLHVRRRAADDTEHLGRCGLMLQGLAQFRIALLQFFEQPHVLDGDDGLVRKGFEKRDLFLGRTDEPPYGEYESTPIGTSSRSSGTASTVRKPTCS